MKKSILICCIVGIACYATGYFTSLKVNTDSIESRAFKIELIEAQHNTLETAEMLLNKHNIWDKDGSDLMTQYMENYQTVDSLLNSQL